VIADGEVLAAGAQLTAQAGRAAPVGFERLADGKNNRVWRLDLADGARLVLKSYFHDARDSRDRLGAEWAFLRYAWARGVRTCPEPLAADAARHLGLYGFAPGEKLTAGAVSPAHVAAALAFVLEVNAPPRAIAGAAPGSEACFSVAGHLATVDRRVARLETLDADAPMRAEAEAFVAQRLRQAWAAVRARVLQEARGLGLDVEAALPLAQQILSPSDFGFHNALAADGRLTFIDFEYAGRDDPAKLVSDFFCCPEIPTPIAEHARFVSGLVAGLGLSEADAARCRLLLDAYRVKWACIILNPFLPLGAARRSFARGEEAARQHAAQLTRAEAKLGEVVC
jgi:hypothetical protein